MENICFMFQRWLLHEDKRGLTTGLLKAGILVVMISRVLTEIEWFFFLNSDFWKICFPGSQANLSFCPKLEWNTGCISTVSVEDHQIFGYDLEEFLMFTLYLLWISTQRVFFVFVGFFSPGSEECLVLFAHLWIDRILGVSQENNSSSMMHSLFLTSSLFMWTGLGMRDRHINLSWREGKKAAVNRIGNKQHLSPAF